MEIFGVDILLLLAQTLRMAVPIVLVALGGAVAEQSGVTNIGLEGMMLIGAFFGVLGSQITGNPWMGLVCAMVAGALTSLILAVWSIRFQCNQIVTGVTINLLATGITITLMQILWNSQSRSPTVANLGQVKVEFISKLPILGPLLDNQSPFIYITFALVALMWILIFRTRFGLWLRAAGEHPLAVATAGVDVRRIRYICVILSGILAGMGGACLSIGQLSQFTRGMSAGRGFIAIAAYIFGQYNPLGTFAAGLIFGFFDALQMIFQGRSIPNQFVQMIPYVATIVALTGIGSFHRFRPPQAVGVPFGEESD